MRSPGIILIIQSLFLAFLSACVSTAILPKTASDVDFSDAAEGKVGWSKYQESARFEHTSVEAVYNAAKFALGRARFSLNSANQSLGFAKGTHGMTLNDWNVVAGVYFRELNDGCDVKVVVEGSKDLGIGGDTTAHNWTSLILMGMRTYLASETAMVPRKTDTRRQRSTGTGFFIDTEGTLLTAYHIVQSATSIEITMHDGASVSARVAHASPGLDLAVLTTTAHDTNCLPLASEESASIGEPVFTIGYPATQVLGSRPKFTDGSISSTSGPNDDSSLYQITVPVQPGNSGGPLLNRRGEVVGVVVSAISPAAFLKSVGSLPQSINFAVKAHYARPLLAEIAECLPVEDLEWTQVVQRASLSVVTVTAE